MADYVDLKMNVGGKTQSVKIEKGCSFSKKNKVYTAENNGKISVFNKETGKKEITRENAEALIETFEHKEAEFKPKNEVLKAYIDKSLQRIIFKFCKTSAIFNPYNE